MEWLDDSKACLDVAEIMLLELEEQIQESFKSPELIPYIKVNIKNILENCRSPLDYAAVYIFETFCKDQYTSKRQMKNRWYEKPGFIITDTPEKFKNEMDTKFKNLYENHREIYDVFKNAQPFIGIPWLDHLTDLVNTNKHRNLTKHTKEHTGTINHFAEDQYGNVFSNNVAIGNPENAIVINGHSVMGSSAANNPYFKKYNATYYYEFTFFDSGLPVMDTLKDIYNGTKTTINQLEKSLEGN